MVNNFILVVFLFLALNFPPFFSLSVADFEPVNASWQYLSKLSSGGCFCILPAPFEIMTETIFQLLCLF